MNNLPPTRNRRILIIDDNRAIHDDFKKIFSSSEFSSSLDVAETNLFGDESNKKRQIPFIVDSAYQGQEGVALIKKALDEGSPYAMAFVDIRMPPGWDGVETIQKLWLIDPEVQIVICTAYSDYSWKEMFEEIGEDDRMVILKKPFDTVEALQLAHSLTEKWWLAQQSKQKIEDLEVMVTERTLQLRLTNQDFQVEIVGHKKTENELRGKTAFLEAQLNSTLDGILVVDGQGRKILQNQRMIELWKIPSQIAEDSNDEKQRQWATSTVKNPGQFAERIAYLNAHPNEISGEEIELKDGTFLDRYSTSVIGKDGIHYGRIWSFRDITQRKKIEAQLFQSQKLEIIGQLAGGVAHDFNNILAAMTLNLEILQMQPQPLAEARSALHEMDGLARRASSLTQQLLMFGQRQPMHLVRLEINAALTNLLKTLERLVGEYITFVWLPSPTELWTEADPVMLNQVLVNLCLNAKDALPNGGKLTLESSLVNFDIETAKLHSESRPGQFACLRISDTGVGMKADVIKHLFEPFFTTKEIGKGTGLGLAASYGIVSQHKGWINVESVLGQGTTVRLYLPLSMKIAIEAKSEKTPSLLSLKGQNETILLVEDEAALLSVTTMGLTKLGYQVLTATNGEEAFERWEQNRGRIDLVLTDMRMPKGMSGLDLAKKIWQSSPSLKVIIMSGYSSEILGDNTAGDIGYTFLAKPFAFKALSEAIRQCLESNSTP
jgi:two-component system, cell cycle sensor histidine kinase and response regulator CckA